MSNFGEKFFRELETDSYLIELYNDILFNYSLKTFNIQHSIKPQYQPRNFNISDALRFADLLSKSNDSEHAEIHKMWAQEIAALVYDLYPEKPEVQFYVGAILHNIGNYQGQKLVGSDFSGLDIYDRIYSEFRKNHLAIPAQPEKSFFQEQYRVYQHLNDQRFSYCAPTSMGKSFIFRMFLKERILSEHKENYAIIVPTKALINEFRNSLTDELRDHLQKHNYKIVTAVWETGIEEDHHFIFVLTPERLLYLLIQKPDIPIEYLFIDEAHKLTAEKDRRSPVYFKVIEMLAKRDNPPHMIFASPCIPNPEIYLGAVPGEGKNSSHYSTAFSPVAQVKYMITQYDGNVYLYNDHTKQFKTFAPSLYTSDITKIVSALEKNIDGTKKQSIIYCSSRANAIEVARQLASKRSSTVQNEHLQKLVVDVKREIHNDYYLAEVLPKGIAYHVGYLPTNIRQRIEKLYIDRIITTVVCTSTLIEGVNLPAENLFIMSYKRAKKKMTPIEFRNMIGRIGRLDYNLFGNVFLFVAEEKDREHFESYLKSPVPEQKLATAAAMTGPQRRTLIDSLKKGIIDFDVPDGKPLSSDQYSIMRQYAIMLVRSIITGSESRIVEAFKKELDENTRQSIHDAFAQKSIQQDDNINISVNQTERLLQTLNIEDVEYPSVGDNGDIDYYEVLSFLEKLCKIYDWDRCEKDTLGYRNKQGEHTKLKWYALILCQWIRGNGLGFIIYSALQHKKNDSNAKIEDYPNHWIPYDGSLMHRNIVISDVLSVVENIILFKFSNYFMRFSETYRKVHGDMKNDWYEYIEYGTTDQGMIWLQQSGFDREAAHYISDKKDELLQTERGTFKLDLNQLIKIEEAGISEQAQRIWFNSPELFARKV